MELPEARRLALRFLVAILLLQAAWILAVPPFRGSDEFDHAYRADAVAHGQWAAVTEQAENGRGGLVTVRRSIVEAAGPVCDSLPYTGRDNCHAVRSVGPDQVEVASGASASHPLFYWVIGTVALPFDGYSALLAMRVAGALLSAAMLALGAFMLSLASRSPWPVRGLAVACTPVFVYSTAVAAPNGPEMAAGVAVWGGLIALGSAPSPTLQRERLILAATFLSALVLVVPRQLGPLWLLMITGICLIQFGLKSWLALIRRHPLVSGLGSALVLMCSLGNVLWVWAAETLTGHEVTASVVQGSGDVASFSLSLAQVPLWVFQSIAAFPLRTERAPIIVYGCYLVVLAAWLAIAFWWADRRLRWAAGLTALLGLLVPFLITFATVSSAGTIWQGRYTLAFTVGLPILLGPSLARATRSRPWWGPPVMAALTVAMLVGQAVSVLNVYRVELGKPASVASGVWPVVPGWLLVVVVLLGLTVAASLAFGPSGDRVAPTPAVDADSPEPPATLSSR